MPKGPEPSAATRTRQLVIDELLASDRARDAESLAASLGIHVTTMRFHLDRLLETNLVRSERSPERRPGRPRLLYSAVRTEERSRRARVDLIDLLALALAERSDDPTAAAKDVGRRWAQQITPVAAHDEHGDRELLTTLDDLGFEPEVTDPRTIELHACPFRESARRRSEVICSVHQGLIDQIVERAENPLAAADLLPFVTSDLCLVTLQRRA